MRLDPAIQKVVIRIAQEFKKLRQQLAGEIAALSARVNNLPTGAGTQGPQGIQGPPGPPGAAGADGESYLVYDIAQTDAPATLTDGFTTTVVLPEPPVVAGKTFTGIRIIRDSRAAVNITATASGAFTSAAFMEYPIIHVFQVASSQVGFVPFYNYRRIHVIGAYISGDSTGLISVGHSSEVKLRTAEFTPNGVDSIVLTDLGHYLPDQVEDGVLLTWGAGSERTWERVRFEYEYTETATAISVSEVTTDETVNELAIPPVANADGVITLTVSGGTGPYSLEINGYGVVATGASPLAVGSLPGGDYEYKVRDSMGAVYPASGWQTIHVYREEFTAYILQSSTKAIQFTPWSSPITVNKYDDTTNPGTVTAVELYMVAATARATAWIENTAASAGTATITVTPALQVEYPAASVISTNPVDVVFTNSLAAFDGSIDWLPTSGARNARRSASDTTYPAIPITPTSDFIGVGTVSLPVSGSASATVTGLASHSLTQTNPEIGCTVSVRYTIYSARV